MQVECAHCGNQQLMQIPGVWTPMPMAEQGVIQGPSVPMVLLGCPQCGFIMLFSPQAVQPQPFPADSEGGADQGDQQ